MLSPGHQLSVGCLWIHMFHSVLICLPAHCVECNLNHNFPATPSGAGTLADPECLCSMMLSACWGGEGQVHIPLNHNFPATPSVLSSAGWTTLF